MGAQLLGASQLVWTLIWNTSCNFYNLLEALIYLTIGVEYAGTSTQLSKWVNVVIMATGRDPRSVSDT